MPNDSYKSEDSGRPTSLKYTYNTEKGIWEPTGVIFNDSAGGSKGGKTPPSSTTPSSSKVDSKTKAEKEFIEIEFNTLVGDLVLVASKSTIKIKVDDTINIQGVGNYLSGLYYVLNVKRQINKDSGYSHTLTVIKTGFGNSLKAPVVATPSPTTTPRPAPVAPAPKPGYKVGDSVKIVGASAVYSNADDGVRVPDWVKTKTLTVDAVSSDGTRVRLQPIWSWTYTKYVQKV